MSRTLQRAALALLLAGGPALAQSPAPAETTIKPRIIVLRQSGQPEKRCVIEKSWQDADGTTCHQVRTLDSGEVLTVRDPRNVRNVGVAKPQPVPGLTPKAPEPIKIAAAPVPPVMPKLAALPVVAMSLPPAPLPMPIPSPTESKVVVPLPVLTPPALAPVVVATPAADPLVTALTEGLLPSERERAAGELARSQGAAAKALLLQAAKDDPAATVRAACIRALCEAKCADADFVTALVGFKTDAEACVVKEAEEALRKIGQR